MGRIPDRRQSCGCTVRGRRLSCWAFTFSGGNHASYLRASLWSCTSVRDLGSPPQRGGRGRGWGGPVFTGLAGRQEQSWGEIHGCAPIWTLVVRRRLEASLICTFQSGGVALVFFPLNATGIRSTLTKWCLGVWKFTSVSFLRVIILRVTLVNLPFSPPPYWADVLHEPFHTQRHSGWAVVPCYWSPACPSL